MKSVTVVVRWRCWCASNLQSIDYVINVYRVHSQINH